MSNNIEKLEYLISLKKTKKDPNSIEREDFLASWTALVKEEQFSERAEKFLYDGFTYCGARPFVLYMKNSNDQIEALNCLYKGKLYGENCTSTCQLLFNLLAHALNDRDIDGKVTVTLLQRIPHALVNKEGKVYGQADRSLKKNFFDVLNPTAQFPNFQQMAAFGLTESAFENFVVSIDKIVGKMDFASFSQKCQSNMANVNHWLHPITKVEKSDASCYENVSDNADDNLESTAVTEKLPENKPGLESAEKPPIQNTGDADNPESDCAGDNFSNTEANCASEAEGNSLQRALDDSLLKIESLGKENVRLHNEILANEKKLYSFEETVKRLQFNLDGKERRITELLDEVRDLRNSIVILEQQQKKNEEDTARRTEMLEMLRRDRTKQSDETVKRIGAKLRTYYTDYKDALDLEMSLELGENMRDQMGEIFRILSSAGVLLK